MAGTRPWVSWYPADILNDPKYLCLSRSARLTYRELLDRLWLAECALPNDTRKLAALAGLDPVEFESDWNDLQDPDDPCFIEHPDDPKKLTNRRMLEEWQKADQQAEIARKNGKRGGRPPKKKNPAKTQRVSSGVPRQNPEESYPHPQPQSHKEKENPAAASVGGKPVDPGPTWKDLIKENYEPEKQKTLLETMEALELTRSTGKMANSVKLKTVRNWLRFSKEKVIGGCAVYLDKDLSSDGKREEYLLGIIRNWQPEQARASPQRTSGPDQGPWLKVIQAIRLSGKGGQGWKSLDGPTKRALSSIGDWSWWCGLPERELSFKRNLFLDAYDQEVKGETEN